MDAGTVGVLGGMITVMMTIMLTVIIYLDRTRRSEMAAGFAAVNGRLDRFEESVCKRFDRIEERFDRLDARFDRLEERFEQIDKPFSKRGLT